MARLEWQTDQIVPLAENDVAATGSNKANYRLFSRALCRAFALRTRWRWAVPHPASAIRGFRSATALRGGGATYYGQQLETIYRTEAQRLRWRGCKSCGHCTMLSRMPTSSPAGNERRAGVYTALQCRVYCGGRYLHIVKSGRFGMVSRFALTMFSGKILFTGLENLRIFQTCLFTKGSRGKASAIKAICI